MEKRIGTVSILISDTSVVPEVNRILSDFGAMIIARQGVPMHQHGFNIITLIIEGTTDELSSLTGKLGRLQGVEVKSMLAKARGQVLFSVSTFSLQMVKDDFSNTHALGCYLHILVSMYH